MFSGAFLENLHCCKACKYGIFYTAGVTYVVVFEMYI